MPGTHSSRRINAIASQMRARSYLEIGVARGRTFLAVDIPEKSAVDPRFAFDWKPHQTDKVRFYDMESDRYFTGHGKGGFDIVMLDGLHVFEQTFRDFCNTLLVTHDRSLILIDDTVPVDIYSAWPDADEAIAARKAGGGSGAAWHGDIFKMVLVIHDFFPMLSYCTIGTEGNPQTLVWRERRSDFQPRFNSLETIGRMGWFELHRNMDLMRLVPEDEALATVGAGLPA